MSSRRDRAGVVTGGTWCADHNKLVETWPSEEELVRIVSEDIRGGGSACNLGIDIKRLDPDLPVSTIGLVGDDADGEYLLQQAVQEGLDCSGLAVEVGYRTTFTDAFTAQDTARRTHLFHPGTSQVLSPDHFDFSTIKARILHLGLPGLHEIMDNTWQGDDNGWVSVLKKARAAGLETNLELCSLPAPQLRKLITPCLNHLDYLIVNDFEIAAVAGRPIDHGQAPDIEMNLSNAKDALQGTPLKLVIVHFPMGAVAVTRRGDQLVLPSVDMPVDKIAGTNGAGDAFAAGALYGLHEGWALEDTVKLAHASAAASMRHIGTTDALVPWSKCLDLAAEYGWRQSIPNTG